MWGWKKLRLSVPHPGPVYQCDLIIVQQEQYNSSLKKKDDYSRKHRCNIIHALRLKFERSCVHEVYHELRYTANLGFISYRHRRMKQASYYYLVGKVSIISFKQKKESNQLKPFSSYWHLSNSKGISINPTDTLIFRLCIALKLKINSKPLVEVVVKTGPLWNFFSFFKLVRYPSFLF